MKPEDLSELSEAVNFELRRRRGEEGGGRDRRGGRKPVAREPGGRVADSRAGASLVRAGQLIIRRGQSAFRQTKIGTVPGSGRGMVPIFAAQEPACRALGAAKTGDSGAGTGHRQTFVHRLDQRQDVFHGRLRKHAVAEVEDVAGPPGRPGENFFGAAADFGGSRPGARPDRGFPGSPGRRRSAARRRPGRCANRRRSRRPPASASAGSRAGLPVAKWITARRGAAGR